MCAVAAPTVINLLPGRQDGMSGCVFSSLSSQDAAMFVIFKKERWKVECGKRPAHTSH